MKVVASSGKAIAGCALAVALNLSLASAARAQLCSLAGLGHVATFDGLLYDVNAGGVTAFMESAALSIQIKTARYATTNIYPAVSVAVRYGTTVYVYDAVSGLKLVSATTSGVAATQSATGADFKFGWGALDQPVASMQDGSELTVTKTAVSGVSGGFILGLQLKMPLWSTRRVQGLCGNWDANKVNDNLGPDGMAYNFTYGTASFVTAWTPASDRNLFVCGAGCPAYSTFTPLRYTSGATPMSCGGVAGAALPPTGFLSPGGAITSPNGQYRLVYQRDGSFVIYQGKTLVTTLSGSVIGGFMAFMQTNGTFVLNDYRSMTYWKAVGTSTDVRDLNGASFVLQDTGKVHIFSTACKQLW